MYVLMLKRLFQYDPLLIFGSSIFLFKVLVHALEVSAAEKLEISMVARFLDHGLGPSMESKSISQRTVAQKLFQKAFSFFNFWVKDLKPRYLNNQNYYSDV